MVNVHADAMNRWRRCRRVRFNLEEIKKKEAEASPASDALRAVPFPAYVHPLRVTGFPQPVQDPI
jgi:hypothetical protein